jgi:putative transposase
MAAEKYIESQGGGRCLKQLRAYPNKEQAAPFAKAFGCARKIYKLMLEGRTKRYGQAKETLRAASAMHDAQCQCLREAGSLAPANAQLNLDAARKSFFQGPDAGFPNFKRKRRGRDSCAANCADDNIRLAGQYAALPKAGRVRIKKHGGEPDYYRLKSCTAGRETSGLFRRLAKRQLL